MALRTNNNKCNTAPADRRIGAASGQNKHHARRGPGPARPSAHSLASRLPYGLSAGAGLRVAAPRTAGRAAAATAGSSAPGPDRELPPSVSRPLDLRVVTTDFLVVGSGIAGLTYALKVAEHGRVVVLTKGAADDGSTKYAQGGICAVLDANDSAESHIRDTLVAGCFLNDPKAVGVVCREGPRRVLELVEWGAEFTREGGRGGQLHLTREGGHSHRRIVHAADATGREIERALLSAASDHPNITILEDHHAVDLVTGEVGGATHCLGCDAINGRDAGRGGKMVRFLAYATMVASGGAGQCYLHTTNPGVVTGDGIAMAHRAGAAVSNLEFVQFHPTGLWQPAGAAEGSGLAPLPSRFLITEAVRGEGGVLLNGSGERFMPRYDDRLELAPRDVVARAIADQMASRGEEHMMLDISHKPAAFVRDHFPNIAAHCLTLGIDISKDPIPVTPVQHYLCGGIKTGLLAETTLPGLYACGEAASTGLHGANRLASNSLLEGLVFAHRAVDPSVAHAEHVASQGAAAMRAAAASAVVDGPGAHAPLDEEEATWVAAARRSMQRAMWEGAGITRTTAGLTRALRTLTEVRADAGERLASRGGAQSVALSELLNMSTVGQLIVLSALRRRESRGGHYTLDFPREVASECRPTVLEGADRLRDAALILDPRAAPAPSRRVGPQAKAPGTKFSSRGRAGVGISPSRDRPSSGSQSKSTSKPSVVVRADESAS